MLARFQAGLQREHFTTLFRPTLSIEGKFLELPVRRGGIIPGADCKAKRRGSLEIMKKTCWPRQRMRLALFGWGKVLAVITAAHSSHIFAMYRSPELTAA